MHGIWIAQFIEHYGNLTEQAKQVVKAKVELPFARLAALTDEDIDSLNCSDKDKKALKEAKNGDITSIPSLSGQALNALMSKMGHDGNNKDKFDKNAYYQIYLKNAPQRLAALNKS